MKLQKICALILCVVLALSCFLACDDAKSTVQNSDGNTTSETPNIIYATLYTETVSQNESTTSSSEPTSGTTGTTATPSESTTTGTTATPSESTTTGTTATPSESTTTGTTATPSQSTTSGTTASPSQSGTTGTSSSSQSSSTSTSDPNANAPQEPTAEEYLAIALEKLRGEDTFQIDTTLILLHHTTPSGDPQQSILSFDANDTDFETRLAALSIANIECDNDSIVPMDETQITIEAQRAKGAYVSYLQSNYASMIPAANATLADQHVECFVILDEECRPIQVVSTIPFYAGADGSDYYQILIMEAYSYDTTSN